ncbi:hypothetical protein GCM10010211_20600 [Streptomyces albospinus]|uniref:Uncharacterized protein n=1 Tax=Streptomyces albospinus TaxID=285515 RepID=A0ABQ2UYA1_9ACTN|nr:hypothetical protein [Streptomyces albospinus]GGU55701.1 hypothetical protein GCM10010211_20600 [Streptomyces albospinus]
MGAHEHGPVELPGGPTDAEGLAVNEQLLGALTGAAVNGCTPCVDRLLDEAAADPASVGRLVEVSRLTALRLNRGELPAYLTTDDDPSGPAAPEFKRLVRAITAAEPLAEVCEQLTAPERRAAADYAIELLVGHLTIANTTGLDDADTLSEMCCAISALLVEWVFTTAPMARQQFTETWHQYALGQREAGLPGNGVHALALLLGAVLHHQARQDQVTVEQLRTLVFTRALPALKDPEQAGAILSGFVAPPGNDDVTVPVKRLARRDSAFLADLCKYVRHTIAMHVKDCPHGLRETDHACILAHRLPSLSDSAGPQVAAPTPEEGRRVALPHLGYSEDKPVEDAPDGYPADHVWQINTGRILLERWDADIAHWNERISEDSSISEPNYGHEVGLEVLACPACGSRDAFLAEGRWGDPLTLHCRCGVTMMSPLDAGPDDLGRLLLKRLILCEADPAYAARRLMPPLAERWEREHQARASSWYLGPDNKDVALLEALDLSGDDLSEALTAALKPKLPERHGGRGLTLFLLQVLYALSVPAVRDSADGRKLADAVRTLVADLREESDRWAPTRQPVLDRLQQWHAEGGPQLWQDAWQRTLDVVGPYFKRYRVGDGRISDGCAGLALALYLLAREADTGVDQIGVDDVRGLLAAGGTGEAAKDPAEVPRHWGSRLEELGHDLDSADDSVARLWRHLRTDRPVHVHDDRREPALVLGLENILGEQSFYRVRF